MLKPEQISPADPLADTSRCKQFGLGVTEVSRHCPKFRTAVSLSRQKSEFGRTNESPERKGVVEVLTSVPEVSGTQVPIQMWTRLRYVGFPNKTRSW